MTSTTSPVLAQVLPQFSNAGSKPLSQVDKGVPAQSDASSPENAAVISGVTVSISSESRLALSDVKKEEVPLEAAEREKAKKDEKRVVNGESAEGASSKVQFVYDQKGELSLRYLDASDRLIYQTPSELMLSLREAALKADSSVDTKA